MIRQVKVCYADGSYAYYRQPVPTIGGTSVRDFFRRIQADAIVKVEAVWRDITWVHDSLPGSSHRMLWVKWANGEAHFYDPDEGPTSYNHLCGCAATCGATVAEIWENVIDMLKGEMA